MPTETIRPTAHTVVDATVTNPDRAYNANTANYAQLAESTPGQVAEMTLHTWAADTSASTRTSVILHLPGSWATGDIDDDFTVFFRKVSTDAWTNVLTHRPVLGWPSSPAQAELTIDVTSLAGSQPSADWQVGYQFHNGNGGDPPVFGG